MGINFAIVEICTSPKGQTIDLSLQVSGFSKNGGGKLPYPQAVSTPIEAMVLMGHYTGGGTGEVSKTFDLSPRVREYSPGR